MSCTQITKGQEVVNPFVQNRYDGPQLRKDGPSCPTGNEFSPLRAV